MTPRKKGKSGAGKKATKPPAKKGDPKKVPPAAQPSARVVAQRLGQAFVAGLSAGGGYATILRSRGMNVQAVQALEQSYGHTGNDPTPYAVACSALQATAQAIADQFNAIGATASVQSGCC